MFEFLDVGSASIQLYRREQQIIFLYGTDYTGNAR